MVDLRADQVDNLWSAVTNHDTQDRHMVPYSERSLVLYVPTKDAYDHLKTLHKELEESVYNDAKKCHDDEVRRSTSQQVTFDSGIKQTLRRPGRQWRRWQTATQGPPTDEEEDDNLFSTVFNHVTKERQIIPYSSTSLQLYDAAIAATSNFNTLHTKLKQSVGWDAQQLFYDERLDRPSGSVEFHDRTRVNLVYPGQLWLTANSRAAEAKAASTAVHLPDTDSTQNSLIDALEDLTLLESETAPTKQGQ